jgi:hypothetical protein
VSATEPLATGTLLRIDGRGAGSEELADPDALDALLAGLARRLEDRADAPPVRIEEADGSSHALPLDEAWLTLHAFPELGRYAFAAFSRHALGDAELYDAVATALRTGGAEASVRRRAADLPRDAGALARRLSGERAWARARLAPLTALDGD